MLFFYLQNARQRYLNLEQQPTNESKYPTSDLNIIQSRKAQTQDSQHS